MKRIAIITGGSRGIGAATAKLAAKAGYDVCLTYMSERTSADETVAACRQTGRQAIAVQADVANMDDVSTLFETCDQALGPVSLLVNNAGITGARTQVSNLTDEVLQRTFAVNVFGTIACARAAIARMSTASGGTGGVIVNISSIAARLGSPNEYVHYAASKGAVDSFTIGLAREVGPEGIRVNAIQAGTTDTGIHARSGNPERPGMVAKTAPLGRVACPEDISEGVMWLASDKAAYITGEILTIAGGL